mmetsp:Transcript_14825/g.28559  ORF Transcript_14825/g.28559 Transcript_14825/m.28559 type:complete len:502 (+) Transcript_14825:138-1643(+)
MTQIRMGELPWLMEAFEKIDRKSVLLTMDEYEYPHLCKPPYQVAFFLEGYLAQCRELKEEHGIVLPTPCWTSFHHRMVRGKSPRLYWPIERCFVTRVECWRSTVSSSMLHFLRLTLLRRSSRSTPMEAPPVYTTVDVYVDVPVPDFCVDWMLFKNTRTWPKGSRFEMSYKDEDDLHEEEMFRGTVVETRAREEDDEDFVLPNSKWEEVVVKWDLDRSTSRVNAWEMQPVSGTPRHRPRVRPAQQSQTLAQPRPRSQPGPSPSRSGAAAQLPHVTDGDRPELYRGYNNREEVQHLWLEPQEETEQNSHSQKVKRKHRDLQRAGAAERKKQRDASDQVCDYCGEQHGALLHCKGTCLRAFHEACLPLAGYTRSGEDQEQWQCTECRRGVAPCGVCLDVGSRGDVVHPCQLARKCGNHFHTGCINKFPYIRWRGDSAATPPKFLCPSHFCAGCGMSGDSLRLLRCRQCVFAWHGLCLSSEAVRINESFILCVACSRQAQENAGV